MYIKCSGFFFIFFTSSLKYYYCYKWPGTARKILNRYQLYWNHGNLHVIFTYFYIFYCYHIFCSYIVFFTVELYYTPKFIQIFKSLNLDQFSVPFLFKLRCLLRFLTYSSYYIHYKNLSFVKTFRHLNLVTLHFIQNNTYSTFCINSVIFILACYNHNCIIYNLLYYTYI